jgi:hypothetical protein
VTNQSRSSRVTGMPRLLLVRNLSMQYHIHFFLIFSPVGDQTAKPELSLGSVRSEQVGTIGGGRRNQMHWQAQTANLKQKVLTSPIETLPPSRFSPSIKPSRPSDERRFSNAHRSRHNVTHPPHFLLQMKCSTFLISTCTSLDIWPPSL